jgi:hypothetical protein
MLRVPHRRIALSTWRWLAFLVVLVVAAAMEQGRRAVQGLPRFG